MLKNITRLLMLPGLLLATALAMGQDPSIAGVQDMNIWHNPSLKVDKTPLAQVSVRKVNYPNIVSYSSKNATVELPLTFHEGTELDNIVFANLAAGINANNSNDQFIKSSTAMLSLSIALPLDYNNTYLAIGFQGNYSFNQVGNGQFYTYPDNFDQSGIINWALKLDPYQTGYNYGYFSLGSGFTFFHTDELTKWYLGGSVRHLNRPYTEWSKSARLPSTFGIQAGYTTAISEKSDIEGYGNFTWNSSANEQILGARFIRHLSDSSLKSLSVGIGYRSQISLLPELSIQLKRIKLAFFYEINVSTLPSRNYGRSATEFSLRFCF